jgi:hypothetical protein
VRNLVPLSTFHRLTQPTPPVEAKTVPSGEKGQTEQSIV